MNRTRAFNLGRSPLVLRVTSVLPDQEVGSQSAKVFGPVLGRKSADQQMNRTWVTGCRVV